MTFWQFIIFVLVPSGILGATGGGLVMYFSNKKLDIHRRMMEERRRAYGKVNELFQGFFNNAEPVERKKTADELLKYYRAIQIWGSDEVIRKFSELLFALDLANNVKQEVIDKIYREFLIAIRKDLLGKTDLVEGEIKIYGKIF